MKKVTDIKHFVVKFSDCELRPVTASGQPQVVAQCRGSKSSNSDTSFINLAPFLFHIASSNTHPRRPLIALIAMVTDVAEAPCLLKSESKALSAIGVNVVHLFVDTLDERSSSPTDARDCAETMPTQADAPFDASSFLLNHPTDAYRAHPLMFRSPVAPPRAKHRRKSNKWKLLS
jgi:hypothetical protein